MHHILVLHGPNLNALGTREPATYGHDSLDEITKRLERLASELGVEVETQQSNHEGVLIDALYRARGRTHGILLNPGGLTHSSVALRDAIVAVGIPVVEVHLSNPNAREEYRRNSLISDAVIGVVQGFGADSYLLGLRALAARLANGST